MAQLGFFDADRRLAVLSAKGDPLEAINALVPWESFRAAIEAVALTAAGARKSSAGRKPIDAIVLLRMLVLQSLYNLSDEQIDYQVRGARNHPLSEAQLAANRNKSKIRARIEHVFGGQENAPGGRLVCTIGVVRARVKIGLANLAYNFRRLVSLQRMAAA